MQNGAEGVEGRCRRGAEGAEEMQRVQTCESSCSWRETWPSSKLACRIQGKRSGSARAHARRKLASVARWYERPRGPHQRSSPLGRRAARPLLS